MSNPYRKVVANGKLIGRGRWMSRTQTLECGHTLRFTGSEKATMADCVPKRRCKECGEIEYERSLGWEPRSEH